MTWAVLWRSLMFGKLSKSWPLMVVTAWDRFYGRPLVREVLIPGMLPDDVIRQLEAY